MQQVHERQCRERKNPLNCIHRFLGWQWKVVLFIAIMATCAAHAQMAGTGAITGTVTDPSGAVVKNAKVTATAIDTNVSNVRSTTDAGAYNISPLSPGTYTLKVVVKGFETFVQENITVNALATIAVNPRLVVGGSDVTVTVSEAPPVLETTDAVLGAVMDNEMYSSLPLMMGSGGTMDQRRATDFASLMPGVQNTVANGSVGNSASGAINGGNPNGGTAEIYIDGVNLPEADGIGDPRFTWTAFGMDAIDQFQVLTVAVPAQYAGQGVQNYSIKQGGNQIHGSMYEYLRNTVLDAWGTNNKTPTPVVGATVPVGQTCSSATQTASSNWCKLGGIKPQEIQNEFGVVLSGPIIKNKLFLFYNYGQYRQQSGPQPQLQTAPTPAMMGYAANGTSLGYADFSGYAAATGWSIYDPATQLVNNCSGKTCTRSQFGNNQIPANRISGAANYINKMMNAEPIYGSINPNLYANNIVAGYKSGLSNWYQSGRLDYAANQAHQLSLIIAFGRQANTGPNGSGAKNALPPPFNTAQSYAPQTNIDILKDTWMINSHTVNQVSLAFGRYRSLSYTVNDESQYSASAMGLLGMPAGQASFFPGITFSGGYTPVITAEAGYDWNLKVNNTYTAMDNLQWDHGKHSVTVGGQIVESQFNLVSNISNSSPMTDTFSSAQTLGYTSTGAAATQTGSSFASYMLGAVNSSSVKVGVPELGTRWLDPSLWFQDNYKATPKLTMNIGLRWDIWPAIHEAHDVFTWLNPTGFNTVTGNLGTLAFAGGNAQDGYHSGVPNPSSVWLKNIAPRLGLAYQLDSKTVIRSSYSLNFARGDWTSGSQSGSPSTIGMAPAASAAAAPSNQPQFYWDGTNCTNGVGLDGFTPCGWTGSVAAPQTTLPSGATMAEFASVETVALGAKNPNTVSYWNPYLGSRTPEYINWSFGVERQLTNDMSVSVSYVGSEGHFLNVANANGARNNKLPESMAGLAGYTLTASGASTQTACSGATCLYPILGQKATAAYLAMAQADGFTPTNPFNAGIASYYASNSVSGYYAAFPQFSGVSDTTSFVGNENWNALEISIKQRQSHGLNWMLNYTFSKVIDDLGTFRVYDNPRLDRSVSTANQPHNLVGTAVYHLPLGKGHMFGDSLAYRAAVSDWSVSGIATYHSGLPIILTGSGCGGAGILGTCEPSLVPGQKGRQHSYGKTASGAKVSWDPSSPNYIGTVSYINPAAFTVMNAGTTANYGTYGLLPGSTTTYATSSSATNQAYFVGNGPALYAPGNAPRVAPLNMYGQSTTNFDMALKRTFPIYRNWKFAFEMDMTNVANHVVYSAPASANNVVQTGTNNTSFGTITNVQNKPRDIQFSGRISW